MSRSILGVFAHPDDECMGPGGTLAHYAAAGHRVGFLTATDGGAGRLYDERPDDNTELRKIRRAETITAADVLGVEFLGFLGWDDGRLSERNILEVEVEVVRAIRTWRPDVVVTFHGSGISYHPDHRVMWLACLGAFFGSAHANWYREESIASLAPHRPHRLYTYTAQRSIIDRIDWPREVYASTDEEITTIVDTTDMVGTRWRAIQAHASQSGGPPFRNMYEAGGFESEAFVLAASTPECGPPSRSCLLGELPEPA